MSRSWLIGILAVVAIAGLISTALAGQRSLAFIRESRYTIPAGTIVRGDLNVEAAAVEIAGGVDGDVTAKSIYFKSLGVVTGSMSVQTGLAEIRGETYGNVQISAVEARIYGVIEGDLHFDGGLLHIMEGAVIHGDVVVKSWSITVTATSVIRGSIDIVALEVTIEGDVQEDAHIVARSIHLTDGSEIGGSLTYAGRSPLQIDDGAVVAGQVRRDDVLGSLWARIMFGWQEGLILAVVVVAIAGCLCLLRVPGPVLRLESRSGAILCIIPGFGLIASAPVLLSLIGMFLITIPLVVVGTILYLGFLFWSVGYGTLFLGWVALPGRVRVNRSACLCAGLALFAVVFAIGPHRLLAPILFASTGAGVWIWQIAARRSRPLGDTFAAIGLGVLFVFMGLGAITVGAVASAATLVTLSGSAALVWEYSPITFGVVAWLLATFAVGTAIFAIERFWKPRSAAGQASVVSTSVSGSDSSL